MSIIEIALIGIALAMDAFAVSICKGLAMSKMSYKKTIIIALFFGVFQALMPLLGYFLGNAFASSIAAIDHWIAFILLGLIGINMIKEALDDEIECVDDTLRIGDLIMLSIATSIDALAVGITFAFFKVSILSAISIIGIITFIVSPLYSSPSILITLYSLFTSIKYKSPSNSFALVTFSLFSL